MFEEEAEERFVKSYPEFCYNGKPLSPYWDLWQDGAEFGYNKGKEDVKYELMMKLKDEGIVKLLKDSIFHNERLNSQEQQELCAWIECAMDFGENLDECAKEVEQLQKINSEQKEMLKKVRIALIQERTANLMNYGKGGVEIFDSILRGVKEND